MDLRPYQRRLINDVYESLRHHKRLMVQLPTGGGKTVILSHIVRDARQRDKTVMIIVHRLELVDQIARTLLGVGVNVGIIRAGMDTPPTPVTVAMVQTLARRPVPRTDLLIIDEAHRSAAQTYRDIIGNHTGLLIGLTATPERLDGRGFNDLYQALVIGPSTAELIQQGHLVPARVYAAPLDQSELNALPKSGGDYQARALADYLESKPSIYGDIVTSYRRHCDGARMIAFAASVRLAETYAAMYRDAGYTAAVVSGTTPQGDRKRIMDAFKLGTTQILVNVAIATEGLDVPECSAVQLLRPTQSLALYLQMVGRALRPTSGKDHAVILDHANATLTHGPVHWPRQWSLIGRKARATSAVDVQAHMTALDEQIVAAYEPDGGAIRSGPQHDTTRELIFTDPPVIDRLPAALRATARYGMAHGYNHDQIIDAYQATNGPVDAITLEQYQIAMQLPRRWYYQRMAMAIVPV